MQLLLLLLLLLLEDQLGTDCRTSVLLAQTMPDI
jgi:hypothetical protein